MTISTDYRVSPYFFIILLSFLLSYLLIFHYSKSKIFDGNLLSTSNSKEINRKHLFYSMLLHFVLSIYCGFMFTAVANVASGRSALSSVGLSGMGGMIGTILSIVIMCFLFKEQKEHYIKCYVMSLPLIYGVSKLGCFFAGCCYGMPYDGPLAVKYLSGGVMTPDHAVFPVQLVECISFLILSVVFYLFSLRINRKEVSASNYKYAHPSNSEESITSGYNILGIEIISCCVLKFLLDYLRERKSLGLSINQKACIIISLLVLTAIFCSSIFRNSTSQPE